VKYIAFCFFDCVIHLYLVMSFVTNVFITREHALLLIDHDRFFDSINYVRYISLFNIQVVNIYICCMFITLISCDAVGL